jgi:hypothetical protein
MPLNDYEGLSQTERSTKIRHSNAVALFGKVQTLIDIGCGTGLVLESFAEQGCLPDHYIGVDMFFDCGSATMERTEKLGVPAVYIHKPEEISFATVLPWLHGAGLAIGVAGYGALSNAAAIGDLLNLMMESMSPGYVTVPLLFEGALNEPHVTRFSEDELSEVVNPNIIWKKNGPHEVALCWGV